MAEARAISVPFSDTRDFVAAIRSLRDARNVTCEWLDEICGFPKGYTQKLLADPPIKNVGPISLFPLVGGLGSAMVLVDDPEAMRRLASRIVARNRCWVRSGAKHPPIIIKLTQRRMKKLGALGGKARAEKLTKRNRIRIAKQAANKRWSTPKIVEIAADEAKPLLEQARSGGAAHSRPRSDADKSARAQGRKARPGQ